MEIVMTYIQFSDLSDTQYTLLVHLQKAIGLGLNCSGTVLVCGEWLCDYTKFYVVYPQAHSNFFIFHGDNWKNKQQRDFFFIR